jgi:hypothetical protein
MVSTYKFDANIQGILRCDATILCGNASKKQKVLIDTCAGICHMSYGLWRILKMNEVCYNESPTLLNLMGIHSADEITFDNLPLLATTSRLGNNYEAKVYEFRLDSLTIGLPTLSSNPITMANITTRIINSDGIDFIIGWNVLKYLKMSYEPSVQQSFYQLTYDTAGEAFFNHDRTSGISNYMQSRFIYLQP